MFLEKEANIQECSCISLHICKIYHGSLDNPIQESRFPSSSFLPQLSSLLYLSQLYWLLPKFPLLFPIKIYYNHRIIERLGLNKNHNFHPIKKKNQIFSSCQLLIFMYNKQIRSLYKIQNNKPIWKFSYIPTCPIHIQIKIFNFSQNWQKCIPLC